MPSVSLVSVNVERSKHLELVLPFLEARKPDVCVQECMERDIETFQKVIGREYVFTPLCLFGEREDEQGGLYGQAIFSLHPFSSRMATYYGGQYKPLSTFLGDTLENIAQLAKALTTAEFEKENQRFCIATTHFTWSQGGETTDAQRTDLRALFALLEKTPELILAGDFNAPRGREIWGTIAGKYKDNVPVTYTSSIDPMHRAAPLQYVVDGLFTTPEYVASDVELRFGVSDHAAITATILKSG